MRGVKLNAMADDGETALSIAKKDQNHNPNAREYEAFIREEFGAKDVDLFSVVVEQMEQEDRRMRSWCSFGFLFVSFLYLYLSVF
jgi:hypothetical protein